MNSSRLIVRRAALALLLAAGACGDDSGDDDDTVPPSDAATSDAGPADGGGVHDGGAADGGNIDGGGGNVDGGDARAPMDARVVEASVPDASTSEIAMALDRIGVRVDARRADIVFSLSCRNLSACDPEENEQECIADVRGDYEAGVAAGYTEACLDSTLDLFSCFAGAACASFDGCQPYADTQKSLCGNRADAGS